MRSPFFRSIVVLLAVFAATCGMSQRAIAQDDVRDFRKQQMANVRVAEAWNKYTDTLISELRKKGIDYPCMDIYLRAFKSHNELELWARNNETSEYRLIKTYRICAVSGQLGPKRAEGDKQIPEGYYFIEEFNPQSEYYLALLLNYPNFSDKIQGKQKPGGNIYIHGGCVTIGCIPMTNEGIKEIYTACLTARLEGQEHIPVHIFPTRMGRLGMMNLNKEYGKDHAKQQFWAGLKNGYDYFEKHHKLLPVMYSPDGQYVN